MKRLTLDQTWVQCLKMWKWIAMKVRAAIKAGESWDVDKLKIEWLTKHGFNPKTVFEQCFFCEWGTRKEVRKTTWYYLCPHCPAVKIDSDFLCGEGEYSYEEYPIAFYAELRRLHKLYKKGLKAKAK